MISCILFLDSHQIKINIVSYVAESLDIHIWMDFEPVANLLIKPLIYLYVLIVGKCVYFVIVAFCLL